MALNRVPKQQKEKKLTDFKLHLKKKSETVRENPKKISVL